MNPADILERAADAIDEFGLAKGVQQDLDGSLCAIGAIAYATGERKFPTHNIGEVNLLNFEPVRLMDKAVGGYVAFWNNAQERTKEEVTSMMRAVATTYRAAAPDSKYFYNYDIVPPRLIFQED